jgi:3-methylfumaryl-CoA hydratase
MRLRPSHPLRPCLPDGGRLSGPHRARPPIATLLADLVRRQQQPDAQLLAFDFKAQRPLFDDRPFTLNGAPSEDGKTVRLWASDHEGFPAMRASATLT